MARGIYMDPHYAARNPTTISISHDAAQNQFAGSHIPSQANLQEVQSSDQDSMAQQAAAPASKAPRAP
jgi:hypothetical protein